MGCREPRIGWLEQPSLHQESVCGQRDRSVYIDTVDIPEHFVGLVTERKWKILTAPIIDHTTAVRIVLATWTVHHLV